MTTQNLMIESKLFNGTREEYLQKAKDELNTRVFKQAGYEIPDDIVCIIRAKNLETGKIKEYKYQYRHAAKKKCRKLLNSGDHELTVVQHDAVHFLYPAENDIF